MLELEPDDDDEDEDPPDVVDDEELDSPELDPDEEEPPSRLAGAALGARRVARLRAVAPAVVRVVEARALEVDRRRVQHLLDGRATFDALRQRVVAHALHDVEQVPVGAAVLVDRHAFSIPTLALGIGQCQRWHVR